MIVSEVYPLNLRVCRLGLNHLHDVAVATHAPPHRPVAGVHGIFRSDVCVRCFTNRIKNVIDALTPPMRKKSAGVVVEILSPRTIIRVRHPNNVCAIRLVNRIAASCLSVLHHVLHNRSAVRDSKIIHQRPAGDVG